MLQHVSNAPASSTFIISAARRPSVDMRVLHVVNGEHFSGAERVQSHLGRCLPGFGVAADFVCVKPGKFAQLLREQNRDWGQAFDAEMKNRFDVRAALRIRDLVHAKGYDLLHAHTPRTALITAIVSKLTGLPWVYHVHSPAARDSDSPVTNRLNAWIEKQTLRGCAHVVTVSESLRRDCLAHGVPKQHITVVHNGVPAIRPKRESVPKPNARWTIGMVALMRPRKGLEIVLDTIAQLKSEGLQIKLRSIGPFETKAYQTGIQNKIDQLDIRDRVEQLGFTTNVPEALARLDAMVLPSLFGEGLPMVVLEAMAAGLPVIATEVEGTPEAVTHGVEGLLAKPRDSSSLADSIRALVTGEYDWTQMSEAACRRHRECFSDVAMASRLAKVYRQLIR